MGSAIITGQNDAYLTQLLLDKGYTAYSTTGARDLSTSGVWKI